MTGFKELQATAGELYSNDESRKWLFSHTYSAEEYRQVRRALKVLAQFKPVRWEGRTGERHAVEVRV